MMITWVGHGGSSDPALGRQTQVDLYEFKVSLVYIVSSRPSIGTY